MSERSVWIIGICSSEADGVALSRVFGTKAEVKRHLVRLVKEDRNNDSEAWEYGDLIVAEVEEDPITGVLNAFATYSDYHIDYSAIPETQAPPMPLDKLGREMFNIKADTKQFNDYMQKWQIRDHNGMIYMVPEK